MTWRDQLRPASFRGVGFKIETGARGGGRRQAVHEFPKRDEPYTEDMGRRARKFQINAYLVSPDYFAERDALIAALEQEGPGLLIHPTFGEFTVSVDTYNAVERKTAGGYVEIDIQMVEAGSQTSPTAPTDNTQAKVKEKAEELSSATQTAVDKEILSV